MNILFVLGNDFDLNLGLKTGFHDFYKYYCSLDSPNELVSDLKEKISGDIENWSDLEYAIGQHTQLVSSVEDMDLLFDDISLNLSSYLRQEEKKFDFKVVDKALLMKHLGFPESLLLPADRDGLIEFKRKNGNVSWVVNAISFNYTKCLELIFTGMGKNFQIGTDSQGSGSSIRFGEVFHIHGYHDKDQVMGVNDISQISNTMFHSEEDVLEYLVKPTANRSNRHNLDVICKQQIEKADVICIFGSSLGATDKIWWEIIGNRLQKECRLIIFSRGNNIVSTLGHPRNRKECNTPQKSDQRFS